jgi:spermidine synthase
MREVRQEPSGQLNRILTLTMFIAGGCLMSIEIVAGLTIAPYFGSSVFVWGSVIGVFMGALSLGYALGGKWANRPRRVLMLGLLLLSSGLLVLLVSWYGGTACRIFSGFRLPSPFDLVLPLAAVCLLYFPSTTLLGMVSPLAVRLAATNAPRVGTTVGRLYAWNALGSVAGGLATTFLFAAFFGNRTILSASGLVLAATSGVVWAMAREPSPNKRSAKRSASPGKTKPVPGLLSLVFTCGAVMMSFEVVAGAQIAPYFGSSVFVWGSVISVFLTAMTLGYRIGGRMVDRRPSLKRLAAVVITAGFLVLLLPLITPPVCQAFQAVYFGGKANILRPLFAAVTLFFLPTMLFALVAPFAVRLATVKLDSVGGVAGKLYALSTLGNLAGVLFTTFLLIPILGKTRVFEIAGTTSLLAALFAMLLHRRALGVPQPLMPPVLVIMLAAGIMAVPKPELVPLADATEEVVGTAKGWTIVQGKASGDYIVLRRLMDQAESPYHHIALIDEKVPGPGQSLLSDDRKRFNVPPFTLAGNRRKLQFDRFTQSSLMLDEDTGSIHRPIQSGTTYTDMLHLPFVLDPGIHDVLVIGGGGGVVPMIFKQSYPVSIDVVEIDPKVIEMAEKWFSLQQDEGLHVVVQDGRMFINNTKKRYDLIVIDVYTAGDRIPFHLTTREFLSQVRARLRPHGIVAVNLISAVKGSKSQLFWAEFGTFRTVFGSDHVYVFPSSPPNIRVSEEPVNIILLGTAPGFTRLDESEIADSAWRLVAEKKVPIAAVGRYASSMLTRKELAALNRKVPILTDDYAPVDMMMAGFD